MMHVKSLQNVLAGVYMHQDLPDELLEPIDNAFAALDGKVGKVNFNECEISACIDNIVDGNSEKEIIKHDGFNIIIEKL